MQIQTQEAALGFISQVERLSELASLGLVGDELATEIEKVEEYKERELSTFWAECLGPLDLDQYGEAQALLERNLALLPRLRRMYEAELLPYEQYAEAFATVTALWWSLAPWRDEIRQYVENQPAFIEEARKEALALFGYRSPTKGKRQPKKTKEQKAIDKLNRIFRKGGRR